MVNNYCKNVQDETTQCKVALIDLADIGLNKIIIENK